MKEKLQELIETYRELCLQAQPTMSDVLDDFEALANTFPATGPAAKFFQFRQNNSGGSFDFDKNNGVSVIVIIEAHSDKMANCIAESRGIEFDSGCPCCGDRWNTAWGNGDQVPTYYDTPVLTSPKPKYCYGQEKQMPEGYIHYLDGRIVPFW